MNYVNNILAKIWGTFSGALKVRGISFNSAPLGKNTNSCTTKVGAKSMWFKPQKIPVEL